MTNRGANGSEKGVLARDVIVAGIKRNIRSIVTDALPGFEDNPRYISELGIKTERDGSLSLTEENFKKNFDREPILFDVMVNSIARSSNPLVSVSHTSDILQPKGGTYSFSESSTDGQGGLLSSVSYEILQVELEVCGIYWGRCRFKIECPGSAQTATIYYGES